MIQKKYKTKESITEALTHLIDVYEKSIYNVITHPEEATDLTNINKKLFETKKVKEEVEKMDLKPLDDEHTYNIVLVQKDGKLYHCVSIERITEKGLEREKEYITNIESK